MLYPLIAIFITFATLFTGDWKSDITSCLTQDSSLILVWVAEDNLFSWRNGDTEPTQIVSGGILQPFIAPHAAHIAFTRAEDGPPITLWLVNADGSDARQLVDSNSLALTEGIFPYINQVAWLNTHTLIFNTALDLAPYNDLRLLDINTGEIQLLLPPGEGGAFTISPDGQWIAVAYHGSYGSQDGRVRLITSDGSRQFDLLTFAGVSTGSEYRFYPQILWEADSTALRIALPNPDLIYDEAAAPLTTLWRLTTDGNAEQIGAVPSSFFGLPQWSSDSHYLTYMQRVGEPADNQFNLILAEGDGTNPITYASGIAGTLSPPIWIADSAQFFYTHDAASVVGSPGQPPAILPMPVSTISFLDNIHYIYATAPTPNYELRLAQVGSPDAWCLITSFNAPVSALDAAFK